MKFYNINTIPGFENSTIENIVSFDDVYNYVIVTPENLTGYFFVNCDETMFDKFIELKNKKMTPVIVDKDGTIITYTTSKFNVVGHLKEFFFHNKN